MEPNHQSSWKARIRPFVPPLLLDIYSDMRYGSSIIKTRNIQFTLPERALHELLPGVESVQVTAPVSELYRARDMVLPLPEVLTLAGICRFIKPRRIFEIGTFTGSSTLVMAINVAEDTEIFTLDLRTAEHVGSAFRDSPYSSKIHQLYGNSLTFDYTPYERSVDLVLVDANHSYENVKSDTEKAFAMLRPGGVIVWDDYRWLRVHTICAGVTVYLNELQATRSLFNIAGTRLAIYVDK